MTDIDDSMIRDFVSGDITARAFRAYLKSQDGVEEDKTSFAGKAKSIIGGANRGEFYLDDWERVFVSDNMDTLNPSVNQLDRMEKIWRRFCKAVPTKKGE